MQRLFVAALALFAVASLLGMRLVWQPSATATPRRRNLPVSVTTPATDDELPPPRPLSARPTPSDRVIVTLVTSPRYLTGTCARLYVFARLLHAFVALAFYWFFFFNKKK